MMNWSLTGKKDCLCYFCGETRSVDVSQSHVRLGACQIFCVNGVSVVSGESIAELNGKSSQGCFPVPDRHRPFLADIV